MGQKRFNPAHAKFLLSSPRWSDAPPSELPMVVVAGRSNVGKSSLINMILGRKNLARTSSTPGRTQLLNFFEVDEQFLLVDVPGYGYAKAPRDTVRRWSENVRKFVTRAEGVRAVIVLFDIRRKPSGDDVAFARLVQEAGPVLLPVITKTDKVSRGQRRKLLDEISKTLGVDFGQLLVTSAKTGEGRTELWKQLLPLMGVTHAGDAEDAQHDQ